MPLFILFLLVWILLSGKFTPEIIATGAVISVLFCLLDSRVLGNRAPRVGSVLRRLRGGLGYLGFLFWEILKAGLVIMKLIYTRGKNIEPRLIYFHTGLETDQAKVALANSITLTAGTITVFAEDDLFCVHTLDRPLAENIEDSKFEALLKKLEK